MSAVKNLAEETGSLDRRPVNTGLIVSLLVLTAAFAFIAYKVTSDEMLPIKQVAVTGELTNVSASSLRQIIENGVAGNFFTINVAKLYQQIYDLPWVKQVWVHRIWPDKLNVEVKAQQPIAVLDGKGLLNREGQLFTQDAKAYQAVLPKFVVAEQYAPQAIAAYEQLVKMLQQYQLEIATFIFDERKSQTIVLKNGIKISLGRQHVESRFSRFLKVYVSELLESDKKIKRVDLRYTNGFSVAFSDDSLSMQKLSNFRV